MFSLAATILTFPLATYKGSNYPHFLEHFFPPNFWCVCVCGGGSRHHNGCGVLIHIFPVVSFVNHFVMGLLYICIFSTLMVPFLHTDLTIIFWVTGGICTLVIMSVLLKYSHLSAFISVASLQSWHSVPTSLAVHSPGCEVLVRIHLAEPRL